MAKTKRIHVNGHRIRSNRTNGETEPVVTVKTYNSNDYGSEVEIKGPSRVVYRPEKPLSCGAELWVETTAPVLIDGSILIS